MANAILSGVAQGLQPLWGNHYGQKDSRGLSLLLRNGLLFNMLLSAAVYLFLLLFDEPVIRIFNQDPSLVHAASQALPIFTLSIIPMSLGLILTAYFYSTKRTVQADGIAVCRGIFLKALCIFYMPVLLGSITIWLAPFVAEGITLLLSLLLKKSSKLVYA